ncbi:MAG TPA: hypothetical protein VMC83_00940 [Streptosporangiaceae bacterium]|nr:hypothetical protein [Streptosporangiaceae bacterium]
MAESVKGLVVELFRGVIVAQECAASGFDAEGQVGAAGAGQRCRYPC